MKKRISTFWALVLLILTNANGQALLPSQVQLNFGNVYENAPDSMSLTITNPYAYTVEVSSILFYATYGENAFQASESSFTIAAGGFHAVWVKFSPRHNIYHNSEMIIINNSERGAVRIDLRGQGKYSNSYYNATENLEEEALKTTLTSTISSGYVNLGYNTARDKMYMEIDNQAVNGQGAGVNTLECVYTGTVITDFANRTEVQAMNFNTEHIFPQSYFGSSNPMLSDLHHLYPVLMNANSARNNNPYGLVTGTPSWAMGGSELLSGVFEPRDNQKGRSARAMMYFVTRYGDYSAFFAGQETILRQWHDDFPPDMVDSQRNSDIYGFQNNRNPYIDYPQFIERISSLSNTSVATPTYNLELSEVLINYDTVPISSTVSYYYYMVNDGNQPLNLSNFNLDHAALSFASGSGLNTILQPGEALLVQIDLFAPDNSPINGNLTFNSDDPSLPNVSIPIMANPGGGAVASLAITEIMYNPPEGGSDTLEYIEIYNLSTSAVNLNGYKFTLGISHVFGNVILNPNAYLVVALDPAQLSSRIGYSGAIAWDSGTLSNGGETIRLESPTGELVDEVSYEIFSPWPVEANGQGHSLIVCNPENSNDFATNWNASTNYLGFINGKSTYGSPGAGEACQTDLIPPSVVDVWAVSPTEIKVVFDETMGPSALYAGQYTILQRVNAVTLNPTRDTACLTLKNPLTLGISYNISIEGCADAAGNYMTGPQVFPVSFGSATDHIVLSEIMYNPPEAGTDSLEYIELYNNGPSAVNLAGYYFGMGVSLTFPSYMLSPGEYVLVGGDTTALRAVFGIGGIQWTSGALSNNGEILTLFDAGGILMDSVNFDDGGSWPSAADGGGYSLTLCDPDSDNNLASNWSLAMTYVGLHAGLDLYASPGQSNFCCVDAFEPNENITQAVSLPGIGIHTTAKLCDNDEDWFVVNTGSLTNAKIRLSCLPADYDLEIYNAGMGLLGASLNIGNTAEQVVLNGVGVGQDLFIRVWSPSNTGNDMGYCLKMTQSAASIWQEESLEIFPNPAVATDVQVLIPANFDGNLIVYDALGRLLLQRNIQTAAGEERVSLSMADFASGIYIVELRSPAFGRRSLLKWQR